MAFRKGTTGMTKMQTLSAWAALLGLIAAAGYFLVADDLSRLEGLSRELGRKQQLLARLEALPAREAQIRDRLATLDAATADNLLYEGDSNATRALIQRDVRRVAGQIGLRLGTMRPVSGPSRDPIIQPTSVQVGFAADYDQLLDFIDAIEKNEPMLRVRKLSTRVQRASTETEAAELGVTMEIAGYRAVGTKGAQP